jgi:AraC-like DNA-binding protein
LLRKNGIPLDESRLEQTYLETQEIPLPTLEAFQRLVQLFAHHIALKLTDQLAQPEASMPPTVLKACRFIRTHALLENINLAAVAKHCGVSTGHLSRLFHHSTCLTFREYLAQVRIEHARDLLLRSGKNVTEVAFDSGFQSISQFHRVFRKAFGMSPGRLRAKHGAPSHSPPPDP